MRNWLQKFMRGRYGVDQLSNLMVTIGVILILASILTGYSILNTAGLIVIGLSYFRIFSRDINRRYMENQKFLKSYQPIKNKLFKLKNRTKNSKDYKYFKCPNCGQELRVPRKKGRVNIKCPKCKTSFVRRT
ncbi:zinc ribbon domain-containing protein [Gudongella sp. SC589]|uniref:hypothetical protein n=1 Tax=Gudongella sp. SC589 TaxID=3385990 RepID=UPI00390467F8